MTSNRAIGEPTHVLVMENDPVLRDAITAMLNNAGIGVRAASNGATGLRLARSILPTAVVLNAQLPELDGATVLQELRKSPRTRQIRAVMLSPRVDSVPVETRHECSACIASSSDIDDLLRALLHELQHPRQGVHSGRLAIRRARGPAHRRTTQRLQVPPGGSDTAATVAMTTVALTSEASAEWARDPAAQFTA